MKAVSIIGAGMLAVGEHWSLSIGELAEEAGRLALDDAGLDSADAVIVGNAYGATFNQQTQLGSLIAGRLGLSGAEAWRCEAGDAAGGVALRAGCLAILSGMLSTVLVIGVEKSTDIVGAAQLAARNTSLDADFETVNGATQTTLAALLMRRYMHENNVELADFAGFSINAHRNGSRNPLAMYRNQLRPGAFERAPMLADPVSLFDSAPDADGAAALVLSSANTAGSSQARPVHIRGSATANDSLMLQDRADLLYLKAVSRSAKVALRQAGLEQQQIDLLELQDSHTIMAALALEALGYSDRGRGWTWARQQGQRIALTSDLPMSSFGGLKSRGNPSGATGIYQAVEAALQLRAGAGDNQVPDARHALIQNSGGLGSTVATHILSATD
ncbi:MAG: thiolase domain-containing protein [Chloroflexi bacterium]|nr:thiolase domain-containing protein [Chloroflexota bacterium]MCY3581434.1 thiolase domain-containing protein [Chloroflexota bacterium]MCY3717285.1 thiolase domain-containing protein [Chloroflexota bacterium]MDE2649202.1 thiolase domain-containing protein [Chloroflexota bacterium]MXV93172.1 thiolase domain-containing protein [Chloroflexota bacterium]